jgi:UDP-N-acetylmuramoylalanine--D-glutamate ligase
VVILGGSDKGADFSELAEAVAKGNVRQVITVGQTEAKITEALRSKGFDKITAGGQTMEQIVAAASAAAQSGDTVLLSTGCASFGLFKDYTDRGNQVKTAVLKLA